MSATSQINPVDFVSRVEPLLARQDMTGLMHLIKSRWTYDQIKQLLGSPHHDARNVAMLAVSLVGGKCCIPSLADHLKDADACANQMAEHALWSIWFRCGSPEANGLLQRGAEALDRKDFDEAELLFSAAIEADPQFAEAYNQRAIVRYLTERYEASIADCEQAVERMPCHFGAWAGMGHGHAHLRRPAEALRCYVKALEINPHLDCIAEAVRELRRQGA